MSESETKKEGLSALVDGELEASEAARVIDGVIGDPELRAAWARYHLMGDALRNQLSGVPSDELVHRVRRSTESEPVPLAKARRRPRPLKPMAGLALAASVAALAIVGIRAFHTTGIPGAVPGPPAGQRTVAGEPLRSGGLRWDVQQPRVEARLNAYLVNHSEYLGDALRGLLPYARIAGYDEDEEGSGP